MAQPLNTLCGITRKIAKGALSFMEDILYSTKVTKCICSANTVTVHWVHCRTDIYSCSDSSTKKWFHLKINRL